MNDFSKLKQGTDEWHLARCGFVTASDVHKVIKPKGAREKTTRDNYRMVKILERVTGKPICNGYVSRAMMDGKEREPEARRAYAAETCETVTEVGFISHPTIPWVGCSPDGLIDGGLIELKCPEHSAHAAAVEHGTIDGQYKRQMTLQLACMPDRQFVDFVSYNPDFPAWARLKIINFPRNKADIAALEDEVRDFIAEVEKELPKWQNPPMSLMEALKRSAAGG